MEAVENRGLLLKGYGPTHARTPWSHWENEMGFLTAWAGSKGDQGIYPSPSFRNGTEDRIGTPPSKGGTVILLGSNT